jgi:hypothetical protein
MKCFHESFMAEIIASKCESGDPHASSKVLML